MDLIDRIAPGLRSLPDALDHAAHVLDEPSYATLAPLAIVFAVGWLLVCVLIRMFRMSLIPDAPVRGEKPEQRRPTNTPMLSRLWWWLKPPRDLMVLDGVQINRDRKPHCLWLGPTGSGKSASVATVRMDGRRPMLIVTPDLSDPLRAKADYVWTACVSPPIDFLIGTPVDVAERLTEVFRSGGAGVWKMAARRATTAVIEAIDESGEPRSLQLIGELLQEMVAKNRELKMACAGWIERFLSTALQFGPSISGDGVDLATLLRQGLSVVLDNDSFEHPGIGGDVVALGLSEAKRCASLVPGGFRLVFEEAGQLGDRIDLADPFFRAGRRRSIAVDALTQAESDLEDAITSNSATRLYFAQELSSLQKLAADRLKIHPDKLDPGTMADFTAWLSHGKVRKLVRFPKPKKVRPSAADGTSVSSRMDATDGFRRMALVELGRRRGVYVEPVEPEPLKSMPMLPPPSTTVQKILGNLYSEGDCERWGGKHDKDGYALVWIDGRWQKVHRVRWELAYGAIPRNPDGTTQTLDHLRTCPKDCSKLAHLTLVTRGENVKRSWRVGNRGGAGGKAKSA